MSFLHPVSVVIPSFNRPQLTLRAVESVLAQTWPNFEVVVVDDGSQSDQVFSVELVDDPRVRLIRHRTNQGVSAARNTGVNESRYPLVAFLDSDDFWMPNKLASQIAVYNNRRCENDVFVYSSYYDVQGNTRTVYPLNAHKKRQALSDYIFLDCGVINTSTWLAQRLLFQRFPFDSRLSQCEDYDLLLRMEHAGVEFVCCQTPTVVTNRDPRADRLSTRLNPDCYSKFLQQNSQRLTPMSYVVLESIILNEAANRSSLRSRLRNHILHFLTSPRLNWQTRIRLVLTYLVRRCSVKIRTLCVTKSPAFLL
jgi:glycosyltransferase involved in cell wall biosynthesis